MAHRKIEDTLAPEIIAMIYDFGQVSVKALLQTWGDALVAHQITTGHDRGGIACPACGFVHGRCADAVYPLLTLFSRSHDEKYRSAALDVFDWAEQHVSQPNGSWHNEVEVPWKGITCFSTIALGETLRHHGGYLTPETVLSWRERLRRGADFLLEFIQFETADINYPLSTSAALAVAWTLLGDEKYRQRARALAHFSLRHFTAHGLLWGEGARGADDLTPRELRPIDICYNVEETLPNLALYGTLTGDETILEAVTHSLRAHLPFLLPDGGWDGGWCSRQYKWSYWGSRTTDGCAGGYAVLRARDARFAAAAASNLRQLARCTHGGLLYGGPHLYARGIPACIQHTFCHAKGLAVALDAGWDGEVDAPPHRPVNGVREWPEAAVMQLFCGPWRASVTANDLPHTSKRGGHPSGGALSLLWHERTGALCVATMNDYVRYEPGNMQVPVNDDGQYVLTPRLELCADTELYSNIYDQAATIQSCENAGRFEVIARGVLKTRHGVAAADGAFVVVYRCSEENFEIAAECAAVHARLVVPIIAAQNESAIGHEDTLEIMKENATVRVRAQGTAMEKLPVTRMFNFVPGVEAVPVVLTLTRNRVASVHLAIE